MVGLGAMLAYAIPSPHFPSRGSSTSPLLVALLELRAPRAVEPYKLQPLVRLSPSEFLRCYGDVLRIFFLVIGPLQLVSYPAVKASLDDVSVKTPASTARSAL